MEVARTVQNHLGTVADWLEKTSNLMTWQDPAKTMRVVQMLTAGLLSSLLIPFWILRVAMKFYIGWKVFVIHPLYRHYPNLKAKHSKSFIRSLPTNAEVSRRQEDADKSDDDSKSITSVGSTNSAKTVTSSPLRQRTASSSSLNRSRTGSSVNVGKGNTPEGNTKSIKPEKVNEQLVQLGVDENMAHLCHLIATLSSSPGYASGWRIKPSHRLAKAACISPPTTWLSYAATRKKLEALPIPVSDS
eukprot:TRINITY_DN10086_c0_g1_i2.p1 TRINITY_DN10086_c0_g1~~TRINITY_DN10086_c0_g1_i2.p1  ORF type:complete len:245 (+),score=25.68 TRINITY_DN10086_c0_g1_i2:410-1144(+)